MTHLLMDDRPIQFLPKLAKALGSCERALVLQQIHWILNQPRSGIDAEGYHWVWGTYEEWCEEYFPMWGPRNLRKHISRLETEGVIISEQLRASQHDQTKYYRIDYDHAIFAGSSTSIRNSSSTPIRHDSSRSSRNTSASSIYRTETSSSKTSSDNDDADVLRSALVEVGVKPTAATLRHYREQETRFGLATVLAGLERAAAHGKADVRAYVGKCIASAATGEQDSDAARRRQYIPDEYRDIIRG